MTSRGIPRPARSREMAASALSLVSLRDVKLAMATIHSRSATGERRKAGWVALRSSINSRMDFLDRATPQTCARRLTAARALRAATQSADARRRARRPRPQEAV